MSHQDEYQRKLCPAAEAVAHIQSGEILVKGMAAAEPPALLAALARRLEAGELTGLRLYYLHSDRHAAATVLRYELMDHIVPFCFFLRETERELIRRGVEDNRKVVHFVPNSFPELPRFFREEIRVDTTLLTVSPMDRDGNFTFGTNNDYGSAAARACRRLIVEVNPRMPRTMGDTTLHISEVDAIVEHEAPLLEAPDAPLEPEAAVIGETVADMVRDGATIQMGVGAIPNAVCQYLRDRRDLGIHTEVLTTGMLDLIRRGVANGRRKSLHPRKAVYTFALGTRELYDALDNSLLFESRPVDYVVDPRVIARNHEMVSINAALQVDLYGQVNAEWLNGHQFTGTGGQLAFVRGAYQAPGGRSIIALPATAKKGQASRIVPHLPGPVTDTRIDTHCVVTEFGVAQLKGKGSSERAEALISIAHPDFREELRQAARRLFLI